MRDEPMFNLMGNSPEEVGLDDLRNELDRRIDEDMPDTLPILPLRNTVLFPGVVIPITVARDKSIQLVKEAYLEKEKLIGVVTQKNSSVETPAISDLYNVGTLAVIIRLIRMPDGSVTIVIQGRSRFNVESYVQEQPYFRARVTPFPDELPTHEETRAMMINLKAEAARIIELAPNIPSEANQTLHNINSLDFLVHFIASNLNLEIESKQEILETAELLEKAQIVLEYLGRELQVLELSEEIQSRVKSDIDKQQRDYMLRQQIKVIQDELGDNTSENDVEELRKRGEEKKWTAAGLAVFEKEMSRLSRINPASPEYAVAMNYLDWLLELPWQEYTRDRFDLKLAQKILDRDHHGLEKVKERIIEFLAVLKLKGDMKAPILCFYGPPGVGKTSLGKSIARSLNRKFVRISLGGVRDEAEIRGHRRTYIGAMPGRIIQGLKKAKTGNPVFMLDEIDKVGNDFRGDPGSALLEVLDPEQNSAFNDHYLELDYDLSSIMFIATANSLDTIHPALRDRMEIIEINGYTMEEKIQIARRHLVPKMRKEHGLRKNQLVIEPQAIQHIIDGYTRESGVRRLTQTIAGICRGVAREIVEKESRAVRVTEDKITKYLGVKRFENEQYQRLDTPGVSIGLAWTPVGGEILFIETALARGNGKLSLTGQLGEVMKESATLAYIFLKANADKYAIPTDVFRNWDIHIHIPAGAIPKDGPSAGTALLTAMASAFTQRLVVANLAMTGEITLRGKVLPVGGIKEKILAAARAGIQTVLLPKANKKDVDEIKAEFLDALTIHYVESMAEVLTRALESNVIENPIDIHAPRLKTRKRPIAPQAMS